MFMQGWVHAQDRLFQMDVNRRQVSGTLAELFGRGEENAIIKGDVEMRNFGLHRAAERSWEIQSKEMKAALKAYSAGVNAFIESVASLPPEYQALSITSVEPWTPIDSLTVIKAIAFRTSFELDIDLTVALLSYVEAGRKLKFDGNALFFMDLFRSAPFDRATTVPDAEQDVDGIELGPRTLTQLRKAASFVGPATLEQGRAFMKRIRDLPLFRGPSRLGGRSSGSNQWVIGSQHTQNGHPLLANDIHLALGNPTIWHEMHLSAPAMDVIGIGLAGAPCILAEHNRRIAWGLSNNRIDVTDTYQDVIQLGSTGLPNATIHSGSVEPIEILMETFRAYDGETVVEVFNAPVFIVSRRNNGPLFTPPEFNEDIGGFTALSVQYTGFSGTRELEGICQWNRSRNLADFRKGVKLIDTALQNVVFADVEGNIAYFTTGEVPVREDLQNLTVDGLPPFFIRNGFTGNEWLPEPNPPKHKAVPFQVLTFKEMPSIINPPRGFIVNANNDPNGHTLDNDPLDEIRHGGGIFYFNWGGRYFSIRAGRIEQMLTERLNVGPVSTDDMAAVQADTVLLDAQVFVPHILGAFKNAASSSSNAQLADLASHPGVAEAVGRLKNWDFTTPTGLPDGFDGDPNGGNNDDSVAATIYSFWRGRVIANTIDAVPGQFGLPKVTDPRGVNENHREEALAALRNLLDNFVYNEGFGESGLNFFSVEGVEDATMRRDIVLLGSLRDALDELKSGEFFGSEDQSTYRWGELHRIVFEHPLGGQFNLPPGGGAGFATDGGFETVDNATHDVLADDREALTFDEGPTNRFLVELVPYRVSAKNILPGGQSGVLGSDYYANQLDDWLVNETHRLSFGRKDVKRNADSIERFVPRNDDDGD